MLALVGSGEYLSKMAPIDQALLDQLSEPAHVVCIPAAAGTEGDAMIDSWMSRGVAHFKTLGVKATGVRVHDKNTAHDETLAEQIRSANFVYLSGGKPNYLLDVMHNSPVWEAILSVHQKGGVVAGCSAGAMIMGEKIMYGGETEAFGLIPNSVIIPHFDEFPGFLTRIMNMIKGRSLNTFGIDGYTALVVNNDGRYQALGLGGVTVIQQSGKKRYTHGETITL